MINTKWGRNVIKYRKEYRKCRVNSKNQKRDSVQFSHSVVSDSLRPHESQHTRPPCPSPTPEKRDEQKSKYINLEVLLFLKKYFINNFLKSVI